MGEKTLASNGRTYSKENICRRRVVICTDFTFLRVFYQKIVTRWLLFGHGDVGVVPNDGLAQEPWKHFSCQRPSCVALSRRHICLFYIVKSDYLLM